MDDLSADELRYLAVASLSRMNGFGTTVIDNFKSDVQSLKPEISFDENDTITLDEIKIAVNNKNLPEENIEIENQNKLISSLRNDKALKMDEQKALYNDVAFYGSNNEFLMMKGKCYDKKVILGMTDLKIIYSLTSTIIKYVLMENPNKILPLLVVLSLL